jgi:hypothetical protein
LTAPLISTLADGPADLQIRGVHDAARDGKLAGDRVEGKALAENVAEVQRDPPRQRLQAEDAEQAADAGFELDELTARGIEFEAAGQRGVVDGEGRAAPREVAGEVAALPRRTASG